MSRQQMIGPVARCGTKQDGSPGSRGGYARRGRCLHLSTTYEITRNVKHGMPRGGMNGIGVSPSGPAVSSPRRSRCPRAVREEDRGGADAAGATAVSCARRVVFGSMAAPIADERPGNTSASTAPPLEQRRLARQAGAAVAANARHDEVRHRSVSGRNRGRRKMGCEDHAMGGAQDGERAANYAGHRRFYLTEPFADSRRP